VPPTVYGICEKCKRRVPAQHAVRDGKVYLTKTCPDHGLTEALVSSDAAVWQRKRELWGYDPEAAGDCRINCAECAHDHHPRMVFVDVTNRCNMNCPICIANIPGMGFEFHPPMAYFQKVIAGLAKLDPPPTIQLFGGEPTVRDDLFEIIELCRRHGLHARVVTNGLRLADEEYCKRLAHVPVLIAFDGRDPEIYRRLRKNPGAHAKKMKAIENLSRYSRRKNTIMVCVARHINDAQMGDLLAFIHQHRAVFNACHLIPLTETWEEGEFETDVHTTLEDVERIMADAVPDEPVEFLPIGLLYRFNTISQFFGASRWTFGGVHPNCETMTVFLSDGERYHPVSYYLRRPLWEVGREVLDRVAALEPRLTRLDPRRWLHRWRGRLLIIRSLYGPVRRAINLKHALKGNTVLTLLRIIGSLLIGRKGRDIRARYTNLQDPLRMIVLPFEEYHSIDGARLHRCTAAFGFEDPDTGAIRTVPVCTWSLFKNDIQRKLAAKYGSARAPAAGAAQALPAT